jgi:hypothetical protein
MAQLFHEDQVHINSAMFYQKTLGPKLPPRAVTFSHNIPIGKILGEVAIASHALKH